MAAFSLPSGLENADWIKISGAAEPKSDRVCVDFEDASGAVQFSLTIHRETHAAEFKAMSRAGVMLPPVVSHLPADPFVERIEILVDHGDGVLTVVVNGQRVQRTKLAIEAGALRRAKIKGLADITFHHRASPVYGVNWRMQAKPSGLPSTTDPLWNRDTLIPGVSFIVRAKNESLNIEGCLRSVADLCEEIVFVDNGSTDDTLAKARAVAKEFPHIKVFSYPIKIPRVGAEHSEAVLARANNTLGEYYNWCLSKSTHYNFTKWDADFICIRQNLQEMYRAHDLTTRGDNICLYYSGLEVYTDGSRWWVDKATMQHEYRLFSKQHGCTWVDIPPWEEVDQSFLYKARKEYFLKPIYLEIFRIDMEEFARRGVYLRDGRDRKRYENLSYYRDHQTLPDNFSLVSGPDDPIFSTMELTSDQMYMLDRARRIWGSVPAVNFAGEPVVWNSHEVPQVTLVVLIMACEANIDRVEKIRKSWAKDLSDQGVSYYFVIGRPDRPAQINGDVLYLPCPDNYESLPLKTLEMLRYFTGTLFDYMLKIDDDTILDADWLWPSEFWKHDYIGGIVAGQWGVMPDWHFGKCQDEKLNTTPYWGEFVGTWYAGGCGYFISRAYAEAAIAHPEIFAGELYEDKAVGDALRAAGLIIGDLSDTFEAMPAADLLAEDGGPPRLLAFDIARDADYEDARDMLRRRARPPVVPPRLGQHDSATVLDVSTDWCLRDDFFRNEISEENPT
jgi:hypothetical protein